MSIQFDIAKQIIAETCLENPVCVQFRVSHCLLPEIQKKGAGKRSR